MPQHSVFTLILITIGLGLGTFIQILDTSIANVSIPWISGDLGVSPNDGTWVITSFAVSNAIVIPLTGWLSTRFGSVRLFIWSTALFAVASFLCGIAWDFTLLVFFRVIQGAVAGCLIPLSQGLLLVNYPPHQKGLAVGFWSMIVIVAPVVGPILGGYITDNYSWPWIFYINVPLGLLSCFLVWKTLKYEHETHEAPVDYVGLILLVLGVGCLQVMLDRGNELDWEGSAYIMTLATISFISFSYFIIWNYYSEHPVVDFKFFALRNFLSSIIACSVGFLLFFGTTVIIPLWLQTAQGYTALWAGIVVAPIGILPVITSPFVGKYAAIMDARWMVTFSFLVFALTFYWLSYLNTDVDVATLLVIRFIQGLGLSFFFIPLITIAFSQVEDKDLSSSSGIFNFIRLIAGGGVGTALYVTFYDRREIFHYSILVEAINSYNPTLRNYLSGLEGIGLYGKKAYAFIEQMLQQQAFLMAVNDLFHVTALVFLLLIPVVWWSNPKLNIKKKDSHVGAGE